MKTISIILLRDYYKTTWKKTVAMAESGKKKICDAFYFSRPTTLNFDGLKVHIYIFEYKYIIRNQAESCLKC